MVAKKLNQVNNMPKVEEAFTDWQIDIVLRKITQINDGGFNVPVETNIKFSGSVQPLSAEQIQLKPEGQRSWEWLQIHVVTGDTTNLETNDRIIYNERPYKVMMKKDYKLNGYVEYHIMQDYE